jgi:anti-anti-sigma factor
MEHNYFDKFNQMDFDTKIICEYLDKKNTQLVININGDMEAFYAKFFTKAFFALCEGEKTLNTIFFNFKQVSYISSSFIATILNAIQKARELDLELFFINLNTTLQTSIDSLGMGHFVKEIDLLEHKSIVIICSNCQKKLAVKKLGRFECPHCGTVLNMSSKGSVKK